MADAFQGAIVKNASDSASSNFVNFTLLWDSETVDTDAIHSTSSNTSRLTIPSALNGRYGVLHCTVELTTVTAQSVGYLYIAKNGAETFDGAAISVATVSRINYTFAWFNVWTAALPLATGDYYEAVLNINDSSTVLQSENVQWSIEVVGS